MSKGRSEGHLRLRLSARFDSAVGAVGALGDDFLAGALTLAHAIDSAALFSIHEGQRPDDQQLHYLAQTFTDQEDEWADVDAAVTLRYLLSLADRKSPLEEISVADATFVSFAVGGWLLSAFISEDRSWVDVLDDILDALESIPTD